MIDWKASRSSCKQRSVPMAITDAERGSLFTSASSPNHSPSVYSCHTACPSFSARALPCSMKYMQSPCSPCVTMRLPSSTCTASKTSANLPRAASSRPCNRGTSERNCCTAASDIQSGLPLADVMLTQPRSMRTRRWPAALTCSSRDSNTSPAARLPTSADFCSADVRITPFFIAR